MDGSGETTDPGAGTGASTALDPGPELLVPARFNGPPGSGNGGWSAGALASMLGEGPDDRAGQWPPVTVRLHRPPRLDTPMPVHEDEGWTVATLAGEPVARAQRADRDLVPVPGVPADEARATEASYAGHRAHPFPTCFSCGVDRAEGDGLRIFPGRVAPADGPRVAATWTPHPSLNEDWHVYADPQHPGRRASVPVTWAALDCVSAWSCDLHGRPMVLGTITACINSLPVIGEPHVVVGEHRGEEGRKTSTASSLYDAADRLVATAEQVWIAVDPATFG